MRKSAKKANAETSEREGYYEKSAKRRVLNRSLFEKTPRGAAEGLKAAGLGGSSIALFGRVGGGIYTKVKRCCAVSSSATNTVEGKMNDIPS